MVNRRRAGLGRREGRVRGQGRVYIMNLSAPMSSGRSIAVMEDNGNPANIEGAGTTPTETDDLKAMHSRSYPVLT